MYAVSLVKRDIGISPEANSQGLTDHASLPYLPRDKCPAIAAETIRTGLESGSSKGLIHQAFKEAFGTRWNTRN